MTLIGLNLSWLLIVSQDWKFIFSIKKDGLKTLTLAFFEDLTDSDSEICATVLLHLTNALETHRKCPFSDAMLSRKNFPEKSGRKNQTEVSILSHVKNPPEYFS